MARKTDFYTTGLEDGKAEKLVKDAFSKHAASAKEEAAKRKARYAEMDRYVIQAFRLQHFYGSGCTLKVFNNWNCFFE